MTRAAIRAPDGEDDENQATGGTAGLQLPAGGNDAIQRHKAKGKQYEPDEWQGAGKGPQDSSLFHDVFQWRKRAKSIGGETVDHVSREPDYRQKKGSGSHASAGDMLTNGSLEIEQARKAPVIKIDDVKFDRNKAKIAVIRYRYSYWQAAKLNNLSLHVLNSILSIVPVVVGRKMFRSAFAKSGGYNMQDQTHGLPRLCCMSWKCPKRSFSSALWFF